MINLRLMSQNWNYRSEGFTLIEMLVVISIIVVLMGLAFPAFQGVQNAAKKTQAKNDLTQLVTAVNAYYTEYGKYPLLDSDPKPEPTFGESDPKTSAFLDVLRANGEARDLQLNPRRIPFVQWPVAKGTANWKSGIGTDGQPYDPWGKPYLIKVDGDYNNSVGNPYSSNAGFGAVAGGVIAWSAGKDRNFGAGDKNVGTAKDDVISWQ